MKHVSNVIAGLLVDMHRKANAEDKIKIENIATELRKKKLWRTGMINFRINEREDIDRLIDWLGNEIIPPTGWVIQVKEYEPRRSISQNALFWQWMTYLADNNYARDETVSKEDWHDYFVHKFLGWTNARKVGHTEIPPTLKHTSELLRKPMTEFMYKIEAFCAERNIYLPLPEDALYLKYREADFGQVA